MQVLYLPLLLVTSRLYYCDTDGYLSADPSVRCWSVNHLITTIISTLFAVTVCASTSFYMYRYMRESVLYRDPNDHEKRLQAWELLHVTNLNQYWSNSQLWLLSPFTRRRVYFRLEVQVFQVILIIIFIGFRFHFTLQSLLLFGMFFCSFLSSIISPPFRLLSSNVIFFVLNAMMLTNSIFGVFNAMQVSCSMR